MQKSDSIAAIAAALVKAQTQMSGARAAQTNPHFKSKYAGLEEVVEAVKKPFADHGIAFSQHPFSDESGTGVTTILMHTSGEWLQSDYVLPMVKSTPQGAGSSLTYARRYALAAVAGLPQRDDDGNEAEAIAANESPAPRVSKKQIAELKAALKQSDKTEEWFLKNSYKGQLDSLADLSSTQFENVMSRLEKAAA